MYVLEGNGQSSLWQLGLFLSMGALEDGVCRRLGPLQKHLIKLSFPLRSIVSCSIGEVNEWGEGVFAELQSEVVVVYLEGDQFTHWFDAIVWSAVWYVLLDLGTNPFFSEEFKVMLEAFGKTAEVAYSRSLLLFDDDGGDDDGGDDVSPPDFNFVGRTATQLG